MSDLPLDRPRRKRRRPMPPWWTETDKELRLLGVDYEDRRELLSALYCGGRPTKRARTQMRARRRHGEATG